MQAGNMAENYKYIQGMHFGSIIGSLSSLVMPTYYSCTQVPQDEQTFISAI